MTIVASVLLSLAAASPFALDWQPLPDGSTYSKAAIGSHGGYIQARCWGDETVTCLSASSPDGENMTLSISRLDKLPHSTIAFIERSPGYGCAYLDATDRVVEEVVGAGYRRFSSPEGDGAWTRAEIDEAASNAAVGFWPCRTLLAQLRADGSGLAAASITDAYLP